jgi:hypothetical protein
MISTLSATSDRNGKTLCVGDTVRSYDCDMLDLPIYTEGILQAIGEDVYEGCPRYRILIVRHHRPVSGSSAAESMTYEYVYPHHDDPQHVYPPVNGTPTTSGAITSGVVKIDSL